MITGIVVDVWQFLKYKHVDNKQLCKYLIWGNKITMVLASCLVPNNTLSLNKILSMAE